MVLTPALVVPDDRSWTAWGVDLHELGYAVASTVATTELLLAPAHVPEELTPALRAAWELMPASRRHRVLGDPLPHGTPLAAVLEAASHHAPSDHDQAHGNHGDHGEHGDHEDMMAITGEPSADGLVMEDLKVTLGPLAPQLPGGLVAELALDGDLVASCALRRTLHAHGLLPDPTTPVAWRAALARRGTDVRGVELERVRSHASWFGALGRLLGWFELCDVARTIVRAVRAPDERALERARTPAARLGRLVDSRRFSWRARGRAQLARKRAEELGLTGPSARASGLARDARTGDPAYVGLGFTPVLESGGDVLARAHVRAREIVMSLGLAEAAPEVGRHEAPRGTAVEGPRGPLRADPAPLGQAPRFHAPGTDAALRAAGEAAVGLEWSAAMLALASFDLSGWAVAG